MSDLRQAAQQALEEWHTDPGSVRMASLMMALEAALAEPEQEPVAWELRMGKTDRVLMEITNNPERAQNWRASLCEVVPLYYAPTPRKPLTDEEVRKHLAIAKSHEQTWLMFARAIERAHGIGDSNGS